MDTSLKTIEEAFKPAYEEIARRRNSDHSEQIYFEKNENTTNLKEKIEDQQYFLFSLSSERVPPISVSKKNPAIRIYGCFQTEEDAREHAEEVAKLDPSCSLFINKTHQWVVAASSIERMSDFNLQANIVTDRLKEYLKERMNDNKEFEQSLKGESVERTVKEEFVPPPVIVNEKSRAHKIKHGSEVHDQKYAVIVFLPDSKTGEPVFVVYGCLSTKEEADNWIRNVVSRKVTEYDLHIVSTCQWLFLNRMQGDNAQTQKYRTPELEKIMQKHKNQPEEIKEYEEMYNSRNNKKTESV